MVTRLSYGLYQIFTQRSVRLGVSPLHVLGKPGLCAGPSTQGLPGQWGLWNGAEARSYTAGPAGLELSALSQSERMGYEHRGRKNPTPPISLFNQKLRLVTILVYLWTESHRIFAKRTILENSGCVLTRAAAQRGELPRRTVDNSENLCPSPLPGGLCTWNRKLQAYFPRHPTSGKRTHSGLSAAQGLVSSHWPGKFFCSQLSENTTLC